MSEYTGEPNDPLRFSNAELIEQEVNSTVKTLLGEKQEACNKTGLKPFYTKNPAPPVRILLVTCSLCLFHLHLFTSLAACIQANSDFWKMKLNPPVRKPRAVKTLVRKKKESASEIPESHDSEVRLDFFQRSPYTSY